MCASVRSTFTLGPVPTSECVQCIQRQRRPSLKLLSEERVLVKSGRKRTTGSLSSHLQQAAVAAAGSEELTRH